MCISTYDRLPQNNEHPRVQSTQLHDLRGILFACRYLNPDYLQHKKPTEVGFVHLTTACQLHGNAAVDFDHATGEEVVFKDVFGGVGDLARFA